MTCYHSVQCAASTQTLLGNVLGLPKHKVIAHVPLIGGSFGGKDTRGLHVAGAAAVAAKKMNRPVRMVLNRNVDTVMCGGRHHCSTDYEVGFTSDGKITALKVKTLADSGINLDGGTTEFTTMVLNRAVEQAYGIENLDSSANACLTNKPSATAMRGPGEIQASFCIETIVEHIAAELKMDPQAVREINIFQNEAEQVAVAKDPLQDAGIQKVIGKDCIDTDLNGDHPLPGIWEHLKQTANHAAMLKEVEDFNKANTWRKRGIAMTPVRYGVECRPQHAHMCVYSDGTVMITIDGTEMGQGIWVKVQQFASHYLSQICQTPVPMESIEISPIATDKIACGGITGGSTTSEACAAAVKHCCEQFKDALQKHIETFENKDEMTFAKLCEKAAGGWGGDIMTFVGENRINSGFAYFVYGACISTVEIDVMTGETCTLASKLCYDCGKSLNPTIDAGQAEGAFVQGLGFFLTEDLIEDANTGEVLSDGTWEYKIPCAQDVPLQFDVEFMPRPHGNEKAVVSSKCSGEPPLVLSTSIFMAVRHAIAAARAEQGIEGFFRLDAPATPRAIAMLCKPQVENFKL